MIHDGYGMDRRAVGLASEPRLLRRRAFSMLVAIGLGIMSFALLLTTSGTAQAANYCKQGMHISDFSPNNPFKQHAKRLSAESDTDITELYKENKAYITYGRTDSAKEYEERFDHPSDVEPQGKNQWGLRTRWADLHPGWLEKGLWFVYWEC